MPEQAPHMRREEACDRLVQLLTERGGASTIGDLAAAANRSIPYTHDLLRADHRFEIDQTGGRWQPAVDRKVTFRVIGSKANDHVGGFLYVGTNPRGEVVLNLPDQKLDWKGNCHVVFSANQARLLAALLAKKADEAEGCISADPQPAKQEEMIDGH